MPGRQSSSSGYDAREKQKRERRKERLEKQLHRVKEQEQEEIKSGDDGHKRSTIGEIIGTKKLRSRMIKKKHQKVLRKLLAIEDHRTEEEENEVETFRDLLKADNLLPARHDDYHTLLRFLRARKFDIEKSKVMWSAWIKWREEVDADHITQTFSFPEEDAVKSHYPFGHHGVDREGRPVYIELVGKADATKVFQNTTMERYVLFHICEFERTFQEKFPACSIASGKHINTTTTIMDVAGFGWKNFSKDARELLAKISNIDGNYYPETLNKMYVINAGATFRAIWATVKPLLDPVTAAKIIVMGANRDRLFEAVDPNELPTIIGGNCTCGGVEGGCFNSDRGPWKDPEIMKMVKVRQTGQYPDSGVDDLVNAAKRLHWMADSHRSDTESETDFSEAEERVRSVRAVDFDLLNPKPAGDTLRSRPVEPLPEHPSRQGSIHAAAQSAVPAGISSEDEASGPMEPSQLASPSGMEPPVPASPNVSIRLYSVEAEPVKPLTVLALLLAAFSKFYALMGYFARPAMAQTDGVNVVQAGIERPVNARAMTVQQIMKRVSKLEEKVRRLEAHPTSSSLPAPDWPTEAKNRVNALEIQLAETKQILTEQQEAFEVRLEAARKKTWRMFFCV